MVFGPKQVRQLRAKLKPANIKTRMENGVALHYVEGWHVISEANRIFGFDGWSRETVDAQCVYTKHNGARYDAVYTTRVRVVVDADGARIVREGSGTGEASAQTPGQAHEFALKAAETDATKRALMTFGNAFGLSLYNAAKANGVETDRKQSEINGAPALQGSTSIESNETITPTNGANVSLSYKRPQNNGFIQKSLTRAKSPIDKSALTFGEPKRIRDPDHLKFVATHRCIVCGRNRTQAHHLTFAQPNALGRKVSDEFVVPLCSTHHQELHQYGDEKGWWLDKAIDPVPLAKELWKKRNPREKKDTTLGE
ncbi:Rad52/Rad22 family DNA repair protein [Hoeflea sp. CAU 1731]